MPTEHAPASPTTPTPTPGAGPSRSAPVYPPSAFRSGVSGISTADSLSAPSRTVRNRLSRNFEDILKDGDTVQLSGGTLDESRLGVFFTPPVSRTMTSCISTPQSDMPSPSVSRSRTMARIQPATPTVVPPTPLAGNSPADGPQVNNTLDSSLEEEPSAPINNTSKRRSLLRSPGTASSPDLATLVRKAKERGGVVGNAKTHGKDLPPAAPGDDTNASRPSSSRASSSRDFLSPVPPGPRTRATSSTSSFSVVTPEPSTTVALGQRTIRSSASSKKLTKQPSPGYSTIPSEHVVSPSRPATASSTASNKSSMRSKANTFLKQFMGSGTAREKRRALSLTSSSHPVPSSEDAPPVPAIPSNVSSTPVADVFLSSTPSESPVPPPPPSKSSASGGATIRPRSSSKGITPSRPAADNEAVTAASIFPPDYAPVARSHPPTAGTRVRSLSTRRRSASVGSIDVPKCGVTIVDPHLPLSSPPRQSNDSSQGPPQLREWDIAMRSVLDGDDFSGAFKGLTNPITPRKDRGNGTTALESRSGPLPKRQPPSRLGASPEGNAASSRTSTSMPRTSESSTASSATISSTRRTSALLLAPVDDAPSKDTLRLVGHPSLHPHHRPESVPLPDTPEGSNGSNMRRPPSPTLSTPSEDVFFDAESTRSSLSTGYTGHNIAAEPKTPVATRLQIPSPSTSSSGPSTPDGRHSSGFSHEPRTPLFSPRQSSLRLPTRSPNPFNPSGYAQQALASANNQPSTMRAAAASTPALVSTTPNSRAMPALRSASTGGSHSRQSPSRSTIAGLSPTSATAQMDVKTTRPGSLDVRLPRSRGRDHSDRASPVQPRAGASSSDPVLISGSSALADQGRTLTPSTGASGSTASTAGYVGEDGTFVSQDGNSASSGSAANRTIRLVGTAASAASVGAFSTASGSSGGTGGTNTLGSSIYTHSHTGASSAISMSSYSQTDLILSRYPSSNKMAQAAAAGATADPEELEARAKVCAEKCWAEDETFVPIEKIAEWLGGRDSVKHVAVKYYMDYFDFAGLRLDLAFRHLCGKLYLRAETQQIDRILQCFSAKFWECNPHPLYRSADVVHAITYSILLLNTDLHVAEISTRMSRTQFVKNTLSVVLRQSDAESPMSIPVAAASTTSLDDDNDGTLEAAMPGSSNSPAPKPATLRHHPKKRSGSLTSWRSIMQHAGASQSAIQLGASGESPTASRVSLNLPAADAGYSESPERRSSRDAIRSTRKMWEQEVENLLKDIYDAVKKQQILQPVNAAARASTSSLGPTSPLNRKGSLRNHGTLDRVNNLKRGSVRGLSSLLGSQSPYGTSSSGGSGDGRVSPSPSFATSIGETLAASSSALHAPTLGFASNLSHTIIKEAHEDEARSIRSVDTVSTSVSISDEELALLGAPWAKEGMLCRKQFWETSKRRAKSRTWMDVFVVISKGEFSMFTFGQSGPSSSANTVGGGNWLANANLVGEFSLAHSLAHSLPAPGYNRQRPYCFVLTLSSGAVYFFQAGTEELVSEWVSTCNYWAARQSREPLSGGVSNMEYGWNRIQVHDADGEDDASVYHRDHADTTSIRSGRSVRLGRHNSNLNRGGPIPAERMFIHEWKPPMPPSLASTCDEETQLEALQKQVGSLKVELERHNDLRKPMQELFSVKSSNGSKAMNNWEQKSQYLLSELVKYQSYVESLREGMSLRLKRRGERALERALDTPAEEDLLNPPSNNKGVLPNQLPSAATSGGNTLGRRSSAIRPSLQVQETIQEAEEPATPGPGAAFNIMHRRESADAGR